MRLRGKRFITAWMIVLILCISGCGTQDEEVLQQGEGTGQHAGTNITTESPIVSQEASAESTVESSTGDAIETTVGEIEGDYASKPAREMTTAEIIKTLKVEGCPMPLPCKVKDLGDGFSLGEGLTLSFDETVQTGCALMYQGQEIGKVFLSEESDVLDQFVDMSTGYEEAQIYAFHMLMPDGDFEISGVTSASTMEDVIGLWGEPDSRSESRLEYYDIDEDTGEMTAYILFSYLISDGSMNVFHISLSR